MTFRTLTLAAAFPIALASSAQAPSDSLFNTDQVVSVHLEFPQSNFWSLLTTYYTNDVGEFLTGTVTITDQTGTYGYDSITVQLKGNSSYSHPGNKKSMKLDFNDWISGQKFHGMTKLHFNNCVFDPTFMREKVFFDYCVDHGVLAPRVQYANVYLNGTHWGFYTMVEAIDKNYLDRWVDDNDGNLFKAGDNFQMGGGNTYEADLQYYGNSAVNYTDRYELKTNEDINDWSDLIALITAIDNTTDAEFAAQVPAAFGWENLLRSFALDNMFVNLDSYINSARNYYVYHDSTTLQWEWIKWDANMAFARYGGMGGGGGGGNLLQMTTNTVSTGRPLASRIMNIPALYQQYIQAYCAMFEDFNNAELDPKIDSLKTLIQDHVYADANKQYTNAQFDSNIESNITISGGGGGGGGGGSQTVYGLKSFIQQRGSYLAGVLDCTAGLNEVADHASLQAYPNPFASSFRLALPAGIRVSAVQAVDALGRVSVLNVRDGEVDASQLAAGSYQLVARVNGEVFRARVVKE